MGQSIPILENLYRKELLHETIESQLKGYYGEALLRTGQLKQSMATADDDEAILTIARDHMLNQMEPYEDWVAPSIALVLETATEHSEFDKEPKTLLLKAISQSINGKWNACLEPLLKLHQDLTTSEDNKDNIHWNVFSLLAECLEQTQGWTKHRDEIDSAEFILLAFGKKHPLVTFDSAQDQGRIEQWKEMLEWYRKETSIDDNLWSSYFEAKLAYETGNWDDADNWMVKAIEFAKDAKQLETAYSDIGASQFMPFEYTDELGDLRMEMAFRSKRSSDWLSKLTTTQSQSKDEGNVESDELDESLKFLHYSINSIAKQSMAPDDREKLIAAMSESKLFEEEALDWIRTQVAKDRFDTETMWEIASRYAKIAKDDIYGRTTWGTDYILAAIGSQGKSESRIAEAEGTLGKEWKPELDLARYVITLDESKRPLKEPRYQFWSNPSVRNWIVERKLFQNLESNVKTTYSTSTPGTGKLLMNKASSEINEKQLASGLASILAENETLQRITAESTNGGVAHWRVLRDDGIILISLFDRPKNRRLLSEQPFEPIGVSYTDFQSALAIAVIPYSQMHDAPSLLTRIAQGMSQSVESSFGYCDEQSGSLLIGDRWREKLAASEWFALDSARPGRCIIDVMQNSPDRFKTNFDSLEMGAEMHLDLRWGHFTESMPVSVIAFDSASSYSTYIVKFQDSSVIDPRLERGWITKAYRDSLR